MIPYEVSQQMLYLSSGIDNYVTTSSAMDLTDVYLAPIVPATS